MATLKTVIVTEPADLREGLRACPTVPSPRRCTGMDHDAMPTPTDASQIDLGTSNPPGTSRRQTMVKLEPIHRIDATHRGSLTRSSIRKTLPSVGPLGPRLM